jgi:hypothetical protein
MPHFDEPTAWFIVEKRKGYWVAVERVDQP